MFGWCLPRPMSWICTEFCFVTSHPQSVGSLIQPFGWGKHIYEVWLRIKVKTSETAWVCKAFFTKPFQWALLHPSYIVTKAKHSSTLATSKWPATTMHVTSDQFYHVIYQDIHKLGQWIHYLRSTLTSLVKYRFSAPSKWPATTMHVISDQLYHVIYQDIHKLGQGIHYWDFKFILSTLIEALNYTATTQFTIQK